MNRLGDSKKFLNDKLSKIYERGFWNGIGFVDDELGEWIREGILTRIEDGTFNKNYDWNKQVTKEIKKNIKAINHG